MIQEIDTQDVQLICFDPYDIVLSVTGSDSRTDSNV